MADASPAVQRLLDRLRNVRTQGEGWEACCPAHDDGRQSLSVGVGEGGRALVHCHAGCPAEAVLDALGLVPADLFPDHDRAGGTRQGGRRVVATYDYTDEAGCLLYQCVRFDPKDFRQRRPLRLPPRSDQDWAWNLGGVRRVLYRLPELLAADPAQPVFVVEGEKDVEALRKLGLVATCNAMGAGKWRKEYAADLKGRHVLVIADNDDVGRKHAADVLASLQGVAARAGLLTLPDLPEHGDVSDWLAAGGTIERLLGGAVSDSFSCVSYIRETHENESSQPYPPPIPASELKALPSGAAWLWEGYLARGAVTMLSALWKAGKTTLLSHLLKSMEEDGRFCGLPVTTGRVLVVTEESESMWAGRRDRLALTDNAHFLLRPFRNKPSFDEWKGFLAYVRGVMLAGRFDLLLMDTLSNLWPVTKENDAAEVQTALMPLRDLTEVEGHAAALFLIHHLRKGDGQEATAARGSGALSAWVDTLLELRRYDAGNRNDRRRVLSGYGRYEETRDELVIELTDAGYVARGDRAETRAVDLTLVLDTLLPPDMPGLTADDLAGEWPTPPAPQKSALLAALNAGCERGRYQRRGRGVKGSPYTFWLAGPPAGRADGEDEDDNCPFR